MENIINSLFIRKFQFVSLLPGKLEQPKRPNELSFQHVITLGLDIFAIQPNFINRDIASRLNAFVMGPLLKFLGVVKVFLANNHQLF